MRTVTRILILTFVLGNATLAAAESTPGVETSGKTATAAAPVEEDENIIKAPPRAAAVRRVFTVTERRKICDRFNGRFIGFAGDVFLVEDCKRRPIISSDYVFEIVRRGNRIVEVDAKPIAAIPEGQPLDPGAEGGIARSCSEFNNRYVTYSSGDLFFVERCVKRLVPDWESYIAHRRARGLSKASDEVLAVSWVEFSALKSGDPIASIVDDEFRKMAAEWAPIDIIPIDEACAGLEGRVVSFYSRLYRVEKCRKREIDAEHFLWKQRSELRFTELRAEQWVSLPDGKPILPEGRVTAAEQKPYDPGAPQE